MRVTRLLRLWKHLTLFVLLLLAYTYIPDPVFDTVQFLLSRKFGLLGGKPAHERTGDLAPYLRTWMTPIDVRRQIDRCSWRNETGRPPPVQRIPKYVHFVRVMDRDDYFGMMHYLAIRAAVVNIKPEKVFYHHRGLPSGEWWDRARGMITDLTPTADVKEIFGNKVEQGAHKADVIRLRALQKWGGIYLDMDVIVTRSFDPLLHHTTVLGIEGFKPWIGLCNAVILTAPNAPFLKRWYDSYRTFDDSKWSDHSVIMPYTLSRTTPATDLCTLPTTAFFWPAYWLPHIQFVHEEDEWDFYNDFQYAAHLYNTGWKYLKNATPEYIRGTNTSFTRLVRPYLPDDV
ncbi:uncharacterized protein EV422DRAFT_542604 [Fimicolochytrium jonesii]|uniref:uncharacterized protein n=1 Tax=Fimicolochytrium jonesii TaxID=1396493 RepID=UPI0022FE3190|nr:uncharacterized protein EV422DRAFT_542604 [Fimicolochytrium jonesii]KAI8817153.1 hypothetical protein EV422DRAFT_542604 [Fimicolochytrium jonesii]